ncbi:hypothetical protein J2Y41_001345 [Arthrobacter sp. 1088]|nr:MULTISPECIES: hypothetical protein [unclassified Arthrobacter]MDR6685790.1 hypothetical protein [Arthrobacter sp. 1088]
MIIVKTATAIAPDVNGTMVGGTDDGDMSWAATTTGKAIQRALDSITNG